MSNQTENIKVEFVHELKLIDALGQMAVDMYRSCDLVDLLEETLDRINKEPLLLSCEDDLLELVKERQKEFCKAVRKAAERKSKARGEPYTIK